VTSIQEIGGTEKLTVLGCLLPPMEPSTKVNGKMINNKAMVQRNGQMDLPTEVNIKMERGMGMV